MSGQNAVPELGEDAIVEFIGKGEAAEFPLESFREPHARWVGGETLPPIDLVEHRFVHGRHPPQIHDHIWPRWMLKRRCGRGPPSPYRLQRSLT